MPAWQYLQTRRPSPWSSLCIVVVGVVAFILSAATSPEAGSRRRPLCSRCKKIHGDTSYKHQASMAEPPTGAAVSLFLCLFLLCFYFYFYNFKLSLVMMADRMWNLMDGERGDGAHDRAPNGPLRIISRSATFCKHGLSSAASGILCGTAGADVVGPLSGPGLLVRRIPVLNTHFIEGTPDGISAAVLHLQDRPVRWRKI